MLCYDVPCSATRCDVIRYVAAPRLPTACFAWRCWCRQTSDTWESFWQAPCRAAREAFHWNDVAACGFSTRRHCIFARFIFVHRSFTEANSFGGVFVKELVADWRRFRTSRARSVLWSRGSCGRIFFFWQHWPGQRPPFCRRHGAACFCKRTSQAFCPCERRRSMSSTRRICFGKATSFVNHVAVTDTTLHTFAHTALGGRCQ